MGGGLLWACGSSTPIFCVSFSISFLVFFRVVVYMLKESHEEASGCGISDLAWPWPWPSFGGLSWPPPLLRGKG